MAGNLKPNTVLNRKGNLLNSTILEKLNSVISNKTI